MDRRAMLAMAALLLVGLVLGAALTSGSGGKDEPDIIPPPGVPANAHAVDGPLGEVTESKIVVREKSGETKELAVTPERIRDLDLPHLVAVHQSGDAPVRVFYVNESGQDVAVATVDLPGVPAP